MADSDVFRLTQEQDTDEMVVHPDASEYFFPGTSTIQTRARYMLFIPDLPEGEQRLQAEMAGQADESGCPGLGLDNNGTSVVCLRKTGIPTCPSLRINFAIY